jgi:hypothetical protein
VTQSDWLRVMADHELAALVTELEARAEQFSAQTRQEVNDELRRRKMPLIGAGQARY